MTETAERTRLIDSEERRADWKSWGPYVAERAWGTVREDYSENGDAWAFFPHDHARSRTYRWNEDGLGGFCNRFQNVCLAVGLWNERDPILKERLFGLTGPEGNHGEDVKELYYYLDSTPTHSYAKMLYKYPQAEFPYGALVDENARAGRDRPEVELADVLREELEQGRYFDVEIEYAKGVDEQDILQRITVTNRGPEAAPIHVLPHLWYRNTWSWGHKPDRPVAHLDGADRIFCRHRHLGERYFYFRHGGVRPRALFTENETNTERLWGIANERPYVKDAIHAAVVHGELERVNPEETGTKVALHYQNRLEPGESFSVCTRFCAQEYGDGFVDFDALFDQRIAEADAFYESVHPEGATEDERRIQRQAYAGLLWTKQFYHYGVEQWLEGDPAHEAPPEARKSGRNKDWRHCYHVAVLSMPDKWEYPWFAAWDTAFHCLPLARVDPEWAKRQLILLLREWYMHPNGQLPAYEWAFGDVNPPVHAWAAWRVYKISRDVTGVADTAFLERVFQKLLMNFTWWVNRKDRDGHNIFQGGFLGLDNIGVFDRSAPLPTGGHLEQADGTAWMGMFCLNMLAIALELARTRPAYEDVATKFFEHFIYIAHAISDQSDGGISLWNEKDGFYYDAIHTPDGGEVPLEIRSFVGLIPLFAVETIEPDLLEKLPRFRRRMQWFIDHRPELLSCVASFTEPGCDGRRLLSLVDRRKLERVLPRMFDGDQFLSPHGLRALSKWHEKHPFTLEVGGHEHSVKYEPAESPTPMFGGNSNWRGPVWFPVNYLMIESLQKFHHYYGDSLLTEVPRYSGEHINLRHAADELARRLVGLFGRDADGHRACFGQDALFQETPEFRDHILFYEYFHGDTGAGLGASHQTGWTALVARLVDQVSAARRDKDGAA